MAETTIEVEKGEASPATIITKTETREVLGKDGNPLALNTAFADALAKAQSKKLGKPVIDEARAKEAAEKEATEEPKAETETAEELPKPEETKAEATETPGGEEKPAEEKEEAKETKPEAKEEDDAIKDEELTVLPHDKPKTRRRILALLEKIEKVSNSEANTKKELAAKDEKLKALEEELAKVKTTSPEVNEELKKELDELKMLRRRYQLENDPEVQTKFTSRIEGGEKTIVGMIQKKGASGEAIAKLIEAEGGWLKFSESGREIPLADGTATTAAELADTIKSKLPLSERRSIEALERDIVSAKIERDRFFEEESKRADEYFKKQTESQKKAQEERERLVAENQKKADEWTKKFLAADWLKEKDGSDDAVKDHNEFVKQVKGELTKALSANSLEDMLKVVEDAMVLHKERRELAAAQARIQALEAKLKEEEAKWEKHKKASASTPRSGSIASSGSGVESSKRPMSIEEAIIAKWKEKRNG